MRIRTTRLAIIACLLLIASVCFAQARVHWTLTVPPGAKPNTDAVLDLRGQIDSGWHVYSLTQGTGGPIKTTIEVVAPLKATSAPTQPTPKRELDKNFGIQVEMFENDVDFKVPVHLGPSLTSGAVRVRYQVCNAMSCMPPKTEELSLSGAKPDSSAGIAAPPPPFGNAVSQARHEGLGSFLLLSLLAGLLALLTPCVFPMVPITVSFFSKQRQEGSGVLHAGAYCLGIISAYTLLGIAMAVIFGASGVQKFATNPWTNLVLGAIFIYLALNLFGVVQLTLPSSLTNRFSASGKKGLLAPALMGLTFTLTSFTCAVPFVGAVLVDAAKGDFLYPVLGMLVFSSAFALPFFLLALFPGYLAKLPKSGTWMVTLEGFMGFVELAAAVKFVSNADLVWGTGILPRPVFLAIWALIALAAALFLAGILPLPHAERPKKVGLGRLALAVCTLGVAVYFASAAPGRSLGELEAFMPPSKVGGWLEDYDHALQVARQTNRPILINFTGVTCTNCRWMEKNMFPLPEVKRALSKYVLVELYTDRERASDQRNQQLQVQLTGEVTLPAYVSVSPEGKVLQRTSTTRDPNEFVRFLKG